MKYVYAYVRSNICNYLKEILLNCISGFIGEVNI